MIPRFKKVFLTILVISSAVAAYLSWSLFFGYSEVDHDLQKEAEANSPECSNLDGEIDLNRIYTSDEVQESSEQAMACINAKIEYIKSKQ